MITPSLWTFLITLINIGVLFLILRKVLFKRVTTFMDNRTAKIQKALDESEESKKQARALVKQYEERLAHAEQEAQNIIMQARKDAQQQADQIIAAGRKEALALVAGTRQQLEADRRAALMVFRTEAAALVVQAASQLVQRELSTDDNRRFAAALIQELDDHV
ncbi:MAG: F0F1 ATP synthase subunit B [Spirochaetaceae bacterium]|jgi:F-type H+-transporting ATPase subunit b|nr:F0F1 ATP synthase subunit B [Spirochaetaceae bacterium]